MSIELEKIKREKKNYREALENILSLTYSTPREEDMHKVVARIRGVSNAVLNAYKWEQEE